MRIAASFEEGEVVGCLSPRYKLRAGASHDVYHEQPAQELMILNAPPLPRDPFCEAANTIYRR